MRKGSYFLCPKCMHLVWAQGKAIWVFCWPRAVCWGSGDRQAGNILSKMFQCLTQASVEGVPWRTVTEEEEEKKKGWVWRILELGYKQLNSFSILVNRIQCIGWIDLFCLCFNLIRNQASVNFPNFSKLKGGGISRQRLCRKFIWMETPLIFISSWCTRATKVVFSKNEILCLSVQFYL